MPTVESTPPADPYRSPQLINSYDPTLHDPFFSSGLISDEQLIPAVVNDTYRTPSPLSAAKLDHLNRQHPTHLSSTYYSHSDQQSLVVNGGHTPSAVPVAQELDGYVVSSLDFLSPSDNYLSDQYLSDHSDTPGYSNGFWPAEEFGPLDSIDSPGAFDLPHLATEGVAPYPINVEIDTTGPLNATQKELSGTDTNLISYLMSPVLTDKASPMSGTGIPDQPLDGHFSKGGDNNTTGFIGCGDSKDTSNAQVEHMQHTPALTGSSLNTSPERSNIPPIARAASPVVRIESYTRGDSPARVARPMMRSGSKRRRGGSRSSFLTVQDDQSSDEDADEDAADVDRYNEQQRLGSPTGFRPADGGTEGRVGLDPLARMQVGNAEVPNLKDQEDAAQTASRNADVEDWLAHSENGSIDSHDASADRPRPNFGFNRRRRARSTGDNTLSRANLDRLRDDPSLPAGLRIPGPGLLLDEESDEQESEDDDEESKGDDDDIILPESPPPTIEVGDPFEFDPRGHPYPEGMPLANETAPPLYRVHLWQDPLRDPTDPGCQKQPVTSNQAIVLYEQRSKDFETLSRVATWGTRPLSESDLASIFHRFSFKEEKDSEKLKGERRGGFLDKLLPRRGSLLKRKESDSSKAQSNSRPPPTAEHTKKDSISSRKESLGVPTLQRMPSLGKKPKSPKINTISAVAAMGNQIAAVGASGPLSATNSPTNPWTATKNIIRRTRSRGELHGSLPTHKLTDLWTKAGGPPMPTLASPGNMEQSNMPQQSTPPLDEDDDEDVAEDKRVTIDFSLRADPIIPKLEGFKANVQQLNPRLPRYMVDRVAQEQLRRYKKLMDLKVKHVQAVHVRKCSSGKHCIELGGEPTYLPSKSGGLEPEHSHTGFPVVNPAPLDEDVSALAEGIVTPAQFPHGVPMPPVKRLPAEFECSLCFKVKKFHKPSDWSKHVHEDVQPFTCTFQTCADPKSFKRKADWVRHENERHRQLEWWQCNKDDCLHKCYRKDNFVQHLVREHKLPEPKTKTAKASKVRGPSTQRRKVHGDDGHDDSSNDEIDQVWKIVEECRHETPKNPRDEPCTFCGNVCTTWKKLTVHLAKHMEQISMPVLIVVKESTVTAETVISPIDQRIAQQVSMSPTVLKQYTHNTGSILHYDTIAGPRGVFPFAPGTAQDSFYKDTTDSPVAGPHHRGQPSTYPPLTENPAARHSPNPSIYCGPNRGSGNIKTDSESVYTQPRDTYMLGYPSFGSPAGPQIISAPIAFKNSQSSSPETSYGVMRGPILHPRSAPYVTEDDIHPGYQHQQQQLQSMLQQQYTDPFKTTVYSYNSTTQSSYQPQVGVQGIQPRCSRGHPELAFSRSQAELPLYSQQPLQLSPPIQQQDSGYQAQTQAQAQAQARAHAQQQQNQQEQQEYPFHRQ